MKIAIYSRKSRLSDRGESIKNQIEMCKNYILTNFDITENDIIVYEDEGFSGGNTDRPEFKRLLNDISKKRFDAIACYRLDRISRNVLDFSNILETLSKHNTSFISITEHFDTTTPMGRAMVNIAAVFAQLERETIAERIKDNMRRLALTGRYIGSTPPLGFESVKIDYIDPNGNRKKMHKLSPVENEINFIKLIYDKYLEFESLSQVETWLMKNSYRNKNDRFIGVSELRRMLTNPVYVQANENVYNYYISVGSNVVNQIEEFNSKNGMLIYGRHDRNNGGYDPKKWTVVIAKHDGVVDSQKWLSVQRLLEENKVKAPRAGTSKNGLLTSKIKCGDCGGTMVLIYGNNRKRHYYKCRNKVKSRKTLCGIKNVNGIEADIEMVELLKDLSASKNIIINMLRTQKKSHVYDESELNTKTNNIKNLIKEKEIEIKNLTSQLRKNESSTAAKYIIADIEVIDNELVELKNSLNSIEHQQEQFNNYRLEEEMTINNIVDFGNSANEMSFEEKRKYIDKIVDKILWDGNSFSLQFR